MVQMKTWYGMKALRWKIMKQKTEIMEQVWKDCECHGTNWALAWWVCALVLKPKETVMGAIAHRDQKSEVRRRQAKERGRQSKLEEQEFHRAEVCKTLLEELLGYLMGMLVKVTNTAEGKTSYEKTRSHPWTIAGYRRCCRLVNSQWRKTVLLLTLLELGGMAADSKEVAKRKTTVSLGWEMFYTNLVTNGEFK